MTDAAAPPADPLAAAIEAQARLHHACLLGLLLFVSSRRDPALVGDWMFRLFRRQHQEKFLASFDKLGLNGLPHAVACARYHVLSNNIGGVNVEYLHEHERKAWVRFRYPRWLFAGPTLCGVPVEVSRGFLRGWYAHNGVSLGNPRLGFVCVSEDMTGQFGLCGYFREYDHALTEAERLQFKPDESPPPFDPVRQPQPPAQLWNPARLARARRNYAVEFVRNAILALAAVAGDDEARQLAAHSARLIGLQYLQETRALLGTEDGDLNSGADYLRAMFAGMGDEVAMDAEASAGSIRLHHANLRILRGLEDDEADLLLHCWAQLWIGAMASFGSRKRLDWQRHGAGLRWTLRDSD